MPSAENFEWPQGNPLFEVQWRTVTESLAGNGIVSNGDFEVTATATDMEISVAAGTAFYIGTNYSLGAAETHILSDGDGTYDRWDTVYFDTGTSSSGVREGTPAANPEPPDISGGELLLAVVYVPTGATNISNTEILNWRAKFSNEAEEVHYDDGQGFYGVNNVDAALDTAISKFVDEAGDTMSGNLDMGDNRLLNVDMITADSGGDLILSGTRAFWRTSGTNRFVVTDTAFDLRNDLDITDDGTVIYEGSTQTFQQANLGGPASSLTSYPLPLGGDTDGDLNGNDLSDSATGSTIWDTSADWIPRTSQELDHTTRAETASGTNTGYTTSGEEVILVDTATNSSPFTVTLSSADVVDGREIKVVDIGGGAASNAITIDTENTETIDGESSTTVDDNYGAIHISTNGTNWFVTGGTAAGAGVINLVEGAESGAVANGDQGILIVDELADGQTLRIQKAVLTTSTVEAVPSGVDLELVTFDNAGSFTSQATLVTGDGSTVHDRVTGSPIASYENTSGGAQSVGVIVDNGSGSSVNIVSKTAGDIV